MKLLQSIVSNNSIFVKNHTPMKLLKFFVLLFISANLNAQGSLDTGLIAMYHLNGNPNDASLSGAHGIVEAASLTTDKNNIANKAYQFQAGANTRIKIPYTSKLNISSTKLFSTSFWVYYTGFNKTAASEVVYYGSLYASNYSVALLNNTTADSGKLNVTNYVQSNTPATLLDQKSNTRLLKNTWYHVALTMDATVGAASTKLYINGVLEVQSNNALVIPTSTSQSTNLNSSIFNIGNHADTDWGLSGKVDEVRLYNRILTPQEVQLLYSIYSGIHQNVTVQNLDFYPNPVTNELNLNTTFDSEYSYTIFDATGKALLQNQARGPIQLSTTAFKPGIYFIEMSYQGQVVREKFIKVNP